MYFYVGSMLSIEWTNQHECGSGAEKANCDIVLQYMCAPENTDESVGPRDGTLEEQIRDSAATFNAQDAANQYLYGMHEDFFYYQRCKQRERNKGLFAADRGVSNNAGARATRQNNNGATSGFECPEERDYYPYWHPTPWKDIAVLTHNTGRCEYYQGNSQNVQAKGNCTNPQFGQEAACLASGAQFILEPSWGMAPPECRPAPYSRDNHLGNGVDGVANTYNWTIPNTPSPRCVLRLRYNISTDDAGTKDYWSLTAGDNGQNSPVKQNPYVPFLGRLLRLAINTAQFGRTFEDRSHVFEIRRRSSSVDGSKRIFNLGVRGKRGNIVEAYPNVEYDFVPNSNGRVVFSGAHVSDVLSLCSPQRSHGRLDPHPVDRLRQQPRRQRRRGPHQDGSLQHGGAEAFGRVASCRPPQLHKPCRSELGYSSILVHCPLAAAGAHGPVRLPAPRGTRG